MDSLLDFASVVWRNFLILDFLQRILVMTTLLGPAAAFVLSLSRLGRRDNMIKGLKAEKLEQKVEIKKIQTQLRTKIQEANSLNPEIWIQQYEQDIQDGNDERGFKLLASSIYATKRSYAKAVFVLGEAYYGSSIENENLLTMAHKNARLASLLAPSNKTYSMVREQIFSELSDSLEMPADNIDEYTHIPSDPQKVNLVLEKIKNRSYKLINESKFHTSMSLATRGTSIVKKNKLLNTEAALELDLIVLINHTLSGNYSLVLDRFTTFLPRLERILPDHEIFIRAITLQANCFNHLNRSHEAVQVLEASMDKIKAFPKETNLSRIRAERQYINTLYSLARYEEAIDMVRTIKVHSSDNDLLMIILLEVKILSRLLRFEEAYEIITKITPPEKKKEVYDKLNFLSYQNFLGRMQWYTGRKEQGYLTFSNHLEGAIELLGKDHIHTISAEYNQAFFMTMDARYKEAIPILENMIENWPSQYARIAKYYHAKNTLARAYNGLNMPAKAIDLLNEIHPLQLGLLGAEHPDTRATMEFLTSLEGDVET